MHRYVILDFLSIYRQQLNINKFKYATISLMGRLNLKEVSNLVLRADEVVTYHVKEPRIYEKSYSFETFANTICDMCVYTKDIIHLKKEDVSNINDPFYLKDISKIDYVSLTLFPIIKNDEVVGTILFYFDEDASFTCKQSDLVKLFDSLQNVQGLTVRNSIDQAIMDNEDFTKIIYTKDLKKACIDSYLKNKLHQKSYILDLNDLQIKRKLEYEILKNKYRKCETENFVVYYANRFDYHNTIDSIDILSIQALNNIKYDDFCLIFSSNDLLDNDLKILFTEQIINKVYVDDSFYVYVINKKQVIKEFLELKNKYSSYYFLLVTSTQITRKMNLMSLAKFIFENKPLEFSFKDYVDYLNKLNNIELNSDIFVSNISDRVFINSVNNQVYGILPSICKFNVETKTEIDVYSSSIYKFIKELCKKKKAGYIIPVLSAMLSSKKIYQALESLQEFDKEVKVIINLQKEDLKNIDLLEKSLSKLRKMNVYVILDSSIYLNIKTLYLLDLANSIYIQNDEYLALVKYPSGINTAIYQYILKNYKEMLIDCDLNKAHDAYFNSLIYYLK